jgi:hypothetical protein
VLDLPSDSAPAPLFLDEGLGAAPAAPVPGSPVRARPSAPRKSSGDRATPPDPPPTGGLPPRASKPRARAEAPPRADFDDLMNPLYAGQDRAAPELDYGRMKAPSPPRKTRGDRAIAAAGRAQGPTPSRRRSFVLLRPALGAWLLPIAALIGVAYLL